MLPIYSAHYKAKNFIVKFEGPRGITTQVFFRKAKTKN